MNLRNLLLILLTLALTLFFIANDQIMEVNLIGNIVRVSKAVLLPGLTLVGFLLGYFLGHYSPTNRKRKKDLKEAELKNKNFLSQNPNPKGLSIEDQKYLE